ncbi:cysteinyl leukotriene receptor 1 [Osmerus mordax]|uniref:cysteinyl leukotriene receptor 1 n=1 Tax=Osmerus mordax TaxID=8014 RepID=UPI0035104AF7
MDNNTLRDNSSQNCPSIDEFRNQVYSTVYSLITVFGLVGNGFAVLVLVRTKRQSSPFHVYMLNLAVSDLLCVSTLPLRVLYYVNKGQWNMGDFLCRISSYALYVNLYCSIFFMTAMSVTRFIAIVFPVQNLRLVSQSRARLVCVGIWVFICSVSSPFLMSGEYYDPATNKTKCFEPPQSLSSQRGRPVQADLSKLNMLNYFSLAVGFILPFLIILISYAGIIRALLSRAQTSRCNRGSGSRAIRMIIIVALAFLLCFTPYHVQRSLHLSFLTRTDTTCDEVVAMQKSVVVTLCLAASNSCFDPLLYFFSGEGFRRRLSTMRKPTMVGNCRPQALPSPTESPEGENCQLKAH